MSLRKNLVRRFLRLRLRRKINYRSQLLRQRPTYARSILLWALNRDIEGLRKKIEQLEVK